MENVYKSTYKPGQTVWFIQSNKVISSTIEAVTLSVTIKNGVEHIQESLRVSKYGTIAKSYLYRSKLELIDAL